VAAHTALNAALTWLASFELTHHQMTALIEKFGNAVVTVLKTDPYLLVREVPGSASSAPTWSRGRWERRRSIRRGFAPGVVHCVAERLDQGDCWVDYEDLIELANGLLVMDVADSRQQIEQALDALIEERILACVSLGGRFLVAQPQITRWSATWPSSSRASAGPIRTSWGAPPTGSSPSPWRRT